MIKEDYVSFEIAKLLKEKGFAGEREIGCRCGFYEQNKEYPNQINLVYDDLNNSELEWNECLRFTHQMAMKWLREVHNIEIAISYGIIFDRNTLKQVFKYFWSIVKVNGLCLEFPMNTPGDVCNKEIEANSYEEAVEAAIKYVLENLI